MCTVLCSLLLGAGFDAYVVAGYAPLAITTSDQTGAPCPLLEPEVVKKPQKMAAVGSSKHPVQPKEAKYKIKSDDKPESTFLQVSKPPVTMGCMGSASMTSIASWSQVQWGVACCDWMCHLMSHHSTSIWVLQHSIFLQPHHSVVQLECMDGLTQQFSWADVLGLAD